MEKILIQSQPITNWTLVEIPIPAQAVTRVAIPDQVMLKSYPGHTVLIKAIECISNKVLTNGMTQPGINAVRAEIIKASLVLYVEGWEKVQYIPLARLISMADTDSAVATTIPFVWNPVTFENLARVDWTKSYIQYASGTTSVGTAYNFILGVQYSVFNDRGEEVKP
jgi:hypothetical protein